MHNYKITYVMPAWFEIRFQAPENLTQQEAWDYMVANRLYQDGEECEWSRGPEFWDDEISDSEAEVILNVTTDEDLYSMF